MGLASLVASQEHRTLACSAIPQPGTQHAMPPLDGLYAISRQKRFRARLVFPHNLSKRSRLVESEGPRNKLRTTHPSGELPGKSHPPQRLHWQEIFACVRLGDRLIGACL